MTLFPWLVIALLIAVNALYVAAEFSAIAVQKSQLASLARQGNRRAAGLLAVLEDGAHLDRYIAACQIGITLSSLAAGAYGQATIAVELAPWLERTIGLGTASAASTAFTLVLLVLTVLQVVLGELVPKSLALQFPERTALASYLPTRWSVAVYRAFIWLLNGSGLLVLRPFGITPGGHQHVHSPEEIRILLVESRRGGALSPEAYQRLERGLQLSTRTIRHMMTPRNEIDALDVSTPPAEVVRRILDSPYSRIPVYRDSLDDVVGAVNTKDVVGSFALRGEIPPLDRLLHPLPFVPETLRAHLLVRMLQEQQSSKAIVVDEYGGVQGIISIEDVLSELFGDIGDELKQPHPPRAERLPDGRVRVSGSMGLDEAETWLGARWQGEASTVGGHIVIRLGRLPKAGEHLTIDGVGVTVTDVSPRRVRAVVIEPDERVRPPREAEAAGSD